MTAVAVETVEEVATEAATGAATGAATAAATAVATAAVTEGTEAAATEATTEIAVVAGAVPLALGVTGASQCIVANRYWVCGVAPLKRQLPICRRSILQVRNRIPK